MPDVMVSLLKTAARNHKLVKKSGDVGGRAYMQVINLRRSGGFFMPKSLLKEPASAFYKCKVI